MQKMPVVMTIAGSDSGGGAGIAADLKTFSMLGVHGTCAITSVTSQNTHGVLTSYDLPHEVVSDQISAVCEDLNPVWTKTGMLPSSDIIREVADCVQKYKFGLVIDPVMSAEAGGSLMRQEALSTLIDELVPLCDVITPNVHEAEVISGVSITNMDDAKKAARIIGKKGVNYVIITGGHLKGSDLIYDRATNDYTMIPGKLVRGGTHGSGCTYSAAIVACLSRNYSLEEAAFYSKSFVEQAIVNSSSVGRGVAPVNQSGGILDSASRYDVLRNVKKAVHLVTGHRSFFRLIPEVGTNLAMAIPYAKSIEDVAAVSGRVVRLENASVTVGDIDFGKSSHVARIILAAMDFDPDIRSALNIKYSKEIIQICRDMGLSISMFDRQQEPENVSTMDWGVSEAIRSLNGSVPDIIYDEGGVGKEAMIRILGKNSISVAGIASNIADQV